MKPQKRILREFRGEVADLAEKMYGVYASIVTASTGQNPPPWEAVKTLWPHKEQYREWMNSAARVWSDKFGKQY